MPDQKITYELKVMTNLPQTVTSLGITIDNPDPLIQEMQRKIVSQAGELVALRSQHTEEVLMLRGFIKTYHFIFNQTMKGGAITGVCPFSIN